MEEPIRVANRFSESKDPYYLCTAAGRQGVLPVLRTILGLLSELPARPLERLLARGPSTATYLSRSERQVFAQDDKLKIEN